MKKLIGGILIGIPLTLFLAALINVFLTLKLADLIIVIGAVMILAGVILILTSK